MRKLLAVLLALILVLGVLPAFAERDRGTVTVIDETIDGEFEEDPDADLFGDNDVVFDPEEELPLDAVTITEAFETLDSVRNILLIGVDARNNEFSGRSDTMILLTVNIEKRTIKLTSFLRDTYVEIPGRKNNRLNAAYAFGGFSLLADTLEKNFGVRPDVYVAINLRGLVDVIDKLGGVMVDVPSNKVDRINAVIYWYNKQVLGLSNPREGYVKTGGLQLLNGRQAEAWARYRYSESDMQRSARQRQLIGIIFEKIKTMSLTELTSFAMNNAKYVKTNMSLEDILKLAPAILLMKDSEISELQIPKSGLYKSQTISEMSVLVPNRDANLKALREFLNDN